MQSHQNGAHLILKIIRHCMILLTTPKDCSRSFQSSCSGLSFQALIHMRWIPPQRWDDSLREFTEFGQVGTEPHASQCRRSSTAFTIAMSRSELVKKTWVSKQVIPGVVPHFYKLVQPATISATRDSSSNHMVQFHHCADIFAILHSKHGVVQNQIERNWGDGDAVFIVLLLPLWPIINMDFVSTLVYIYIFLYLCKFYDVLVYVLLYLCGQLYYCSLFVYWVTSDFMFYF